MAQYEFGGRTDQAKAALKRWTDAKRLRDSRRWRGAMYLAGYAIECKLKARLMEMYNVSHLDGLEAELDRRFGRSVDLRTHSIEYLLEFTQARQRLDANECALQAFRQCNKWSVNWRYNPDDGSREKCDAFFEEIEVFKQFIENNI